MRKHFRGELVCRCTSAGEVMYLEAKTLRRIMDEETDAICEASTCPQMAQKGLTLGDLCAQSGHLLWAIEAWSLAVALIHNRDYEDWIDVSFNPQYVRLRDVISYGMCEVLGRRIDAAEEHLGLAHPHGRDSWEFRAGDGWYDGMWLEKYDSDWEEYRQALLDLRSYLRTEQLFRDAQSDLAPQPISAFQIWDEDKINEENLYLKVDDWDED